MIAQQYRLELPNIRLSESDLSHCRIGQFVFGDEESTTASGFISDTDAKTFLEITLFEPTDLGDDALAVDVKEVADWFEILRKSIPLMSGDVVEDWTDAVTLSALN